MDEPTDNRLTDRRILVAGAAGFLGAPLVDRLVAAGAEVHAVVRADPAPALDGAAIWVVDAADADGVRRVVAEISPEIVYQLTSASRGGPEVELVPVTLRDDLLATLAVLTASLEAGVERVVMTASLEEPVPGTSRHPTPTSPYAAAKWAASGYGRMFHALYGLPVVGLRPFMTYGPGQRHFKLVPHVTLSLLRGERPRIGSGERLVDWVYRDDVVDAFVRAATAPAVVGETIDVGSGETVAIRDVVAELYRIVGVDEEPLFGVIGDRPAEVERRADVGQAARLLGWRATTSLTEGLRRTIEAYRDVLAVTGC